ncbi:MAG: hypothetical protein ABI678_03915 [Kofleriaceae bacterium]
MTGLRLILLGGLAACGHGPDGTAPDSGAANTDGASDADERPPVTIHADNAMGPAEGIHVVVNDADGAVVASLVTGSDGNLAAVVRPGGSIQVFTAAGSNLYQDGYFDPTPGSTITVFDGFAAPSPDPLLPTTFYFQYIGPGPVTHASYTLPCGSGASNASNFGVTVSTGSCAAQDYPVAIVLMSGGSIVASTELQTFPLSPGNMVTVAAPPLVLGSTGTEVIVDNAPFDPSMLTRIGASSRFAANRLPAVSSFASSATSSPAQLPLAAAEFYEISIDLDYGAPHLNSAIHQRWLAPTVGVEHYDATALVIASLATPDLSTPARPRITWAAAGQRGMGGHVALTWQHGTIHGMTTYRIPPDGRLELATPALPAELASYTPTDPTSVTLDYFAAADAVGTAYDYTYLVEHGPPLETVTEPGPAHVLWTRSEWYP